jgi:hypothetical protein
MIRKLEATINKPVEKRQKHQRAQMRLSKFVKFATALKLIFKNQTTCRS